MLHTALPLTAATAVTVTAAELIDGAWGRIITLAAVCTALTVIAHFTHAAEVLAGIRKLSRLAHLQESFLEDWNGEPARPGVEARPSMPAQMADNRAALIDLGERVEVVNQRVSNHQERNEQTIQALQDAVDALGRDQLLLDTARAVLTELGHDGELPIRRVDGDADPR